MRFLVFVALLLVGPAYALPESTAKQSFTKIIQCADKEDIVGCRDSLTASSIAIYDRFVSYGLAKCLPKGSAYLSQKQQGPQVIIRASVGADGKRFMRLIFVEEEGQWKLDVPESLHLGMGDNWEKNLNMTEQAYLVMKQYMGDKLNCGAINAMAAGNAGK